MRSWPLFTLALIVAVTAAHAEEDTRHARLVPSLGVNFVNYKQTAKPDTFATLAQWNMSYLQPLPPQELDLDVSAYITLFPIFNPHSPLRYLGASTRLGYSVPGLSPDWTFTFAGGAFYSTMYLRTDDVGYENIFGPQLLVTSRRALQGGSTLAVTVKYSVVSDTGGIELQNREFGIGFSWSKPVSGGGAWLLNLDLAALHLHDDINKLIDSDSATVCAGFAF